MKVNYRTHPILEKLESGRLGKIPIYDKDLEFFKSNIEPFKIIWDDNVENFKKEINFISKPFFDASILAWDKLRDLWYDIIKNHISDIDISGTFIFNNKVYMFDYHVKSNSQDAIINILIFEKTGIPLALFVQGKDNGDLFSSKCEAESNDVYIMWISQTLNIGKSNEDMEGWILDNFVLLIVTSFFKSYAQVELKYLPAGKRIKEINCKYINETKLPITYLDSKWFTTLVKSDAFKVRGHFRLQPKKKEGKWTHELIWINDFMKTGYTAPAKKLSQVTEAL